MNEAYAILIKCIDMIEEKKAWLKAADAPPPGLTPARREAALKLEALQERARGAAAVLALWEGITVDQVTRKAVALRRGNS